MNREIRALQLGSFVYRTADKADNDRPWHKIGDILGIYITKRSEAGRATEVIVKGSQERKFIQTAQQEAF